MVILCYFVWLQKLWEIWKVWEFQFFINDKQLLPGHHLYQSWVLFRIKADSASIFPCPAVSSRVVLTCRFLWDKIQWQIGLKWAMSVTWGRWIFQKMFTHFGRFRPSPTLFNVWCFGVAEALRFIAATSQHQSVWSDFWGSNSYIYSAKLSCDDRPWRPWRKRHHEMKMLHTRMACFMLYPHCSLCIVLCFYLC